MSFKFDVGTPIQIPEHGTSKCYAGQIVAQEKSPDPYGERYLIKTDKAETAVWYQRAWVDGSCFVSQLSFKEQRMEEDGVLSITGYFEYFNKLMNECFNSFVVKPADISKLDEIAKYWRPN